MYHWPLLQSCIKADLLLLTSVAQLRIHGEEMQFCSQQLQSRSELRCSMTHSVSSPHCTLVPPTHEGNWLHLTHCFFRKHQDPPSPEIIPNGCVCQHLYAPRCPTASICGVRHSQQELLKELKSMLQQQLLYLLTQKKENDFH